MYRSVFCECVYASGHLERAAGIRSAMYFVSKLYSGEFLLCGFLFFSFDGAFIFQLCLGVSEYVNRRGWRSWVKQIFFFFSI